MNNNTKTPINNTNYFIEKYNSVNDGLGSVLNIGLIFIGVVIIMWVIYKIYQFYTVRKVISKQYQEIIGDSHDGKVKRIVESHRLPANKLSNEYAISFWLRIDDFNYKFKEEKNVMLKGNKDGSNANPMVFIDPHTNNLIFKIKMQTTNPVIENKLGGDLAGGVYDDILLSNGAYGVDNNESNGVESFDNVSGNKVSCKKTYDPRHFSGISGNQVPSLCKNGSTVEGYIQGYKEGFQDDGSDNAKSATKEDNETSVSKSQLDGISSKLLAETKMKDISEKEYKIQMMNLVEGICGILSWLDSESDNITKMTASSFNGLFDGLETLVKSTNMDPSKLSESQFINDMNITFDSDDNSIKTIQENLNLIGSVLYLKKVKESGDLDIDIINQELMDEIDTRTSRLNCDIKLSSNNSLEELLVQFINKVKDRVKKMIVKVAVEISDEHIMKVVEPTYSTCVVKDFPLQKWTHVVISVNNNVSDVYIDGQLNSSCVFDGFPVVNTDDLYFSLDGGYDGGIAKVVFVNGSLNHSEVYDLYAEGPVNVSGLWNTIKSNI